MTREQLQTIARNRSILARNREMYKLCQLFDMIYKPMELEPIPTTRMDDLYHD